MSAAAAAAVAAAAVAAAAGAQGSGVAPMDIGAAILAALGKGGKPGGKNAGGKRGGEKGGDKGEPMTPRGVPTVAEKEKTCG